MKFHKRVVVLSYQEFPICNSDDELNEFYRALGRMVAYGLADQRTEEDTVRLVNLYLDKETREITGAYSKSLPAYLRREDGSLKTLGSNDTKIAYIQDELRSDHPFVMGAVPHDGKYGFHS